MRTLEEIVERRADILEELFFLENKSLKSMADELNLPILKNKLSILDWVLGFKYTIKE